MTTSPTTTNTTQAVEDIVVAADDASSTWRRTATAARASTLRAVADAVDAAAPDLVQLARSETHLGLPRLTGELTRTTFQLRFLADVLDEGTFLQASIDHADPGWPMGAPRPDLRRQLEPIGPVVVFAASNFPFAFSVIGGDSASALAAGNAVVLKAHPGHPALSDATHEVVVSALAAAGAPAGLFATIHGTEAGVQALRHPLVKAAAFTGSIVGGRALFDIAVSRPEPIPFYGELGSVNPVFVSRAAASARPAEIVDGFIGSFAANAGQLCTKPGVLLVPADSAIPEQLAAAAFPEAVPMLNPTIHAGFVAAVDRTAGHPGVTALVGRAPTLAESPAPSVLRTSVADLLADPERLLTELFGPTSLVVTYEDEAELVQVAEALDGQLTTTIVADEDDAVAPALLEVLTRKAGRVLWNQWPTGLSVTWAQQHGGPYPATTAVGTTSVGAAALDRFLRPVTYQNVPDALLPAALQEANPLRIPRRVDGVLVTGTRDPASR